MNPTVSVVITCYNYGKFIEDCLKSVQQQIYQNFEVIIVDDGSTDNSEKMIRPFLKDERFRYIWQKNGGHANAKNCGVRECQGKFIAFLDADDLWLPEKLAKQIPLFSDKSVGVVYSRIACIDQEGKPRIKKKALGFPSPRRGRMTDCLIYDNVIPFSSAVVRSECFTSLGVFFDESLPMGTDWDIWLRFSMKYKFDYCEEKLTRYRVGHSGQISKNLQGRFQCADRIISKFTNDFPSSLCKSRLKCARYYSCCVRGYALRKYGIKFSLQYYFKAILIFPLKKQAYIGAVKAFGGLFLKR
ncbi:MAG: glycosyltransferase family 2 protein [Candidatus Electrothrix communis]|nr:MAG: glycosyltransferase family 2 protein [Candidatus Electrothrix communis]